MAGFGWSNEFPMEFGGGPTLAERHYNALVRAPGKGGVATDEEGSIDAIWRQCKARALGNLDAFAEHAALQVFPLFAEEMLAYYEDVLALVPGPGAPLAERQAAVQAEWNRLARADGPALLAALQRIDPRFELTEQDYSWTATTEDGRMVAPWQTPFFGYPGVDLPNFSDDMAVYVYLPLGGGVVPSQQDALKLDRARRLLHIVLPSWVDFHVVTAIGFVLDSSLLDVTAFGS